MPILTDPPPPSSAGRFPFGVTAIVERPGGQDQYGNPLPVTTHEVLGCGVAPGGSTEETHDESTVEWDLDLLTIHAADLRAEDVVLLPPPYHETRYQVVGKPKRFQSPFTGWEAGAVVRLKGVG